MIAKYQVLVVILQFLFLVNGCFAFYLRQSRTACFRAMAHSFWSTDHLEAVIEEPFCGFFDGLVEHEGQSWDSGETELRYC